MELQLGIIPAHLRLLNFNSNTFKRAICNDSSNSAILIFKIFFLNLPWCNYVCTFKQILDFRIDYSTVFSYTSSSQSANSSFVGSRLETSFCHIKSCRKFKYYHYFFSSPVNMILFYLLYLRYTIFRTSVFDIFLHVCILFYTMCYCFYIMLAIKFILVM